MIFFYLLHTWAWLSGKTNMTLDGGIFQANHAWFVDHFVWSMAQPSKG